MVMDNISLDFWTCEGATTPFCRTDLVDVEIGNLAHVITNLDWYLFSTLFFTFSMEMSTLIEFYMLKSHLTACYGGGMIQSW